ncbi:MAG TPA: hypothetical protein VJI15_03210 [Candidatus Nanoarchaeia archaeon]|nr:hypothetical protein [Candidatus Nanoarchaeia archaeon]
MMEVSVGFERAVVDASYRSSFLHSLAAEGLPRYVSKLTYNPTSIGNGESETLMRTVPNPLARLFIKGTASTIEIFPAAFSPDIVHRNLDDFLSTLEDHEYFHAQEFYERPRVIAHPLWRRLEFVRRALGDDHFEDYVKAVKEHDKDVERRAVEHQIKKFSQRNCSPKYQVYRAMEVASLNPYHPPIAVKL